MQGSQLTLTTQSSLLHNWVQINFFRLSMPHLINRRLCQGPEMMFVYDILLETVSAGTVFLWSQYNALKGKKKKHYRNLLFEGIQLRYSLNMSHSTECRKTFSRRCSAKQATGSMMKHSCKLNTCVLLKYA